MYESSFRVYKMLCCGIFCNITTLVSTKKVDD